MVCREKATCEEDEEDDLSGPLEACSALQCGPASRDLIDWKAVEWLPWYSQWLHCHPPTLSYIDFCHSRAEIPAADTESSHQNCIKLSELRTINSEYLVLYYPKYYYVVTQLNNNIKHQTWRQQGISQKNSFQLRL